MGAEVGSVVGKNVSEIVEVSSSFGVTGADNFYIKCDQYKTKN